MKKSISHKEIIRSLILDAGFDCCGFARINQVHESVVDQYCNWLSEGKHGSMAYLERYPDIRRNPELLLPGSKTIIAVALNYFPAKFQPVTNPQFAYYAYGDDYHNVIRARLAPVTKYINDQLNAETRICVDSAPLRERYWAQQAGIGFIGRNNMLIVPGRGSYFFLGFIITTLEITPDSPCHLSCMGCRRCIIHCPSKALNDENGLDARLCHSALTIEHRGTLPDSLNLGNKIYGCDICQKVCPHNHGATPTTIEEFNPSTEFMNLSREKIISLSPIEFNSIFRNSAVKRIKLPQLLRNLHHLNTD